jgi:hypothetical protein
MSKKDCDFAMVANVPMNAKQRNQNRRSKEEEKIISKCNFFYYLCLEKLL